jgi:hypothetical protein
VAVAREHGGFAAELVAAPTVTYRNLLGWIRLTQGRFAEAEGYFRAALAEAEAQHEHFFIASEASHVALTLAFAGSPGAEPFVASAVERATQVGAVRQLAQARVADALVRLSGAGALAELEQVRRDLRLAGDEGDERLPLLGSVLVLVRAGRTAEAQQRAQELAQLMDERLTHRCLGQIARWLAFPDAEDSASSLVWGDDAAAVAARWRAAG